MKKIDINNAYIDDTFENKVTSKVSKIREEGQATKIWHHDFVSEYKGNLQNESMINKLPKQYNLSKLGLMLFQKKRGLKEHIPLQKYRSYI